MSKIVIEKQASDNKYLHKDFHISKDLGISYVGKNFGDKAVIEYLTKFTLNYYKPLIEKINKEGLSPLKKHIDHIYKVEESSDAVITVLSGNCLTVNVKYCPAIKYMKGEGHVPSEWYIETTRTVNNVIAQNTGYDFKLIEYDEDTGKALYIFSRRA